MPIAVVELGGARPTDATNSFRLYDAEFLRTIEFESTGGFEITLKAWKLGHKVVEVPCTWRDRVEGESRFLLRKWLPRYGRLWVEAMTHGLLRKMNLRALYASRFSADDLCWKGRGVAGAVPGPAASLHRACEHAGRPRRGLVRVHQRGRCAAADRGRS